MGWCERSFSSCIDPAKSLPYSYVFVGPLNSPSVHLHFLINFKRTVCDWVPVAILLDRHMGPHLPHYFETVRFRNPEEFCVKIQKSKMAPIELDPFFLEV